MSARGRVQPRPITGTYIQYTQILCSIFFNTRKHPIEKKADIGQHTSKAKKDI